MAIIAYIQNPWTFGQSQSDWTDTGWRSRRRNYVRDFLFDRLRTTRWPLTAVVCESPGCKSKSKKKKKKRERERGGKRKKGERASIRALAPRGEIIDSAVKIIERKRASRCLPGRRAIQSRGTPARNRDNGTRHEPPTSSTATVYPLRGGSLSLSATGHLIDAFVSTFSRSIHPRLAIA